MPPRPHRTRRHDTRSHAHTPTTFARAHASHQQPRRSRGKYGKRKHLSADEKAELTRQRNRENARSTRKRRKMYIKHLQEVVETLKARQQAATQFADPKVESGIQETRTKQILSFFECRSSGILEHDRWSAIVDQSFRLTLPVCHTPSSSPSPLARPLPT